MKLLGFAVKHPALGKALAAAEVLGGALTSDALAMRDGEALASGLHQRPAAKSEFEQPQAK
jgi:hypothetical protein